IFLPNHPNAVFFLMPFRVFEFAIGAGVFWTLRWAPPANLTKEFAFIAGLAMMLCSFFLLTEAMPFPGPLALAPCVGAALAIYGGDARYASRVFSNRVMVSIGAASYSIYLVHWPMIVFFDA